MPLAPKNTTVKKSKFKNFEFKHFALKHLLIASFKNNLGASCFTLYLYVLSTFLSYHNAWKPALAYAFAGISLNLIIFATQQKAPIQNQTAHIGLALLTIILSLFLVDGIMSNTPENIIINAGLLTFLWLVVRNTNDSTNYLNRIKCFYLGIAMILCYSTTGKIFDATNIPRYDNLLFDTEVAIFGTTLNQWCQQFITPLTSDTLSFFYMFFQPWLDWQLIRYFIWRKELLVPFYNGMFITYGLGFIGYVILPAKGAFKAFPEKFDVPITGGWLTTTNHQLVSQFATGIDVFPSLHVGASTYMLGFLWQHQRKEAYFFILPTLIIFCSTLYLRYHYAIDVICGLLLASIALWINANQTKLKQTP
jgi:membrane-associated phospholipid phosphatase